MSCFLILNGHEAYSTVVIQFFCIDFPIFTNHNQFKLQIINGKKNPIEVNSIKIA